MLGGRAADDVRRWRCLYVLKSISTFITGGTVTSLLPLGTFGFFNGKRGNRL
jgi:hypothetical protein